MKVLLAGCSGFIGRSLIHELAREGHELILLSRNEANVREFLSEKIRFCPWDGKGIPQTALLEKLDGVVNLCGEGIAEGRWTEERKARLLSSRLDTTNALVQFMSELQDPPKVLVNASAVGFYGSVPEGEVDESASTGHTFLADICKKWEVAALKAESYGVRVALMRIGIVLEQGGGAFAKMVPPFKAFIGGPLGSGKQWFPWVHRDDVVGLIRFALENEQASGPINVTAPEVVRMSEFCQRLGAVLGRPSWAPVPAFMLKLLLGEMSEMLLTGQKAIPKKACELGYEFKYASLDEALRNILGH